MQNHEGRQSSNGSDPLITVVLPIYNVAKWLDTCIQSIVKQTYRNLQIILVDDGSTDESPTICERWAAKDNRINVVHQQNAGLSAARNTGLRLRKGEYVCFVDSDDYVEHDYVQRMLDTALAEQADMVVCNVRKEDENGDTPAEEADPGFETKTLTSRQYMIYAMQSSWKHIVAWNKLYRSEIWDDLTHTLSVKFMRTNLYSRNWSSAAAVSHASMMFSIITCSMMAASRTRNIPLGILTKSKHCANGSYSSMKKALMNAF